MNLHLTASMPVFAIEYGPFFSDNAAVLLPAALGFLALYFMAPRVRNAWMLPAVCVGLLGLALGGVWLIHFGEVAPESVLFYAFAGLSILSGTSMIAQKKPVYAAMSFALVVLSTSGLFLLLAAPFLTAATVIVYAGAIVVTFLFVIMLAQQGGVSGYDQQAREPFLSCLAGFILLASLVGVLRKTYDTNELDALAAEVDTVAKLSNQEELHAVLGDPNDESTPRPALLARLRPYFDKPADKLLDALEHDWVDDNWEKVRSRGIFVAMHLESVRRGTGSLHADLRLPVSKFSGPYRDVQQNAYIPHENVAAIGRSMFTDHLLAVGLAGILLLVASIGAIAISGRAPGGLR